MILSKGRLFLWRNDLRNESLVIKVGSGSGVNDFVRLDDTDLFNKHEDVNILYATEKDYEAWTSNKQLDIWKKKIGKYHIVVDDIEVLVDNNIAKYIDKETRKIVIYVKIESTSTAIELGEIGLFAEEKLVMALKYYDKDKNLYFVQEALGEELDYENARSLDEEEPENPELGDMYVDESEIDGHPNTVKVYTYTATEQNPNGEWIEEMVTTKPIKNDLMISRNLIQKQFISSNSDIIIKYTINI